MSVRPTEACQGPYVCPYPEASEHRPGERWTCPGCGARYRLTRPKRDLPWRNWSASHGYWRRVFRDQFVRRYP